METFERARLDAYFARIAAQFAPGEQTASFLITHLLAERPAFVRAVAAMTRLTAVLPKPKSVHPAAKREVEQTHMVDHGASVGPFIFLVQAEILAAIRMLTRGDLAPGIHEVPAPDREAIAATWLSYFNR